MTDDLRIGDLVRVVGEDEWGQDRTGMTGVCLNLSPLYVDVRLTCEPGTVARVLRSPLTLVNPRPMIVPEPQPEVVVATAPAAVVRASPPVSKPRRKRTPRIAIAPSETVYPPVVEPMPRPVSRLREKLAARITAHDQH